MKRRAIFGLMGHFKLHLRRHNFRIWSMQRGQCHLWYYFISKKDKIIVYASVASHMWCFKMPPQLNTTQATWGHSINFKLIPNGFSIQYRNEILHYCPNVKCKRKMISTWCRTLILKYSCVFSLTVENLLAISFSHSSLTSGYTTTRKVTTIRKLLYVLFSSFFLACLKYNIHQNLLIIGVICFCHRRDLRFYQPKTIHSDSFSYQWRQYILIWM